MNVAFPHRTALIDSFPKGSVGAEIGVLLAGFSQAILNTVKPSVLYLVDCWLEQAAFEDKQPTHDNYRRIAMERMGPHIAKGIVRVLPFFSGEAAKLIPDESMDWVYIDADHTYEGCLSDLKAYYPKIKHGGVISGHDYTERIAWYGVCKAVADFMEEQGLTDLKLTSGINELAPSFYLEKR